MTNLLTQLDTYIYRRQQADDALVEQVIARSHAPQSDDAGQLIDVAFRCGLDMADIRQRIAQHVRRHESSQQLAAGLSRIGKLKGDIAQRKAFAALVEQVDIEQLKCATEGGIARSANNPQPIADWFRTAGLRGMADGVSWRRADGSTSLQFEMIPEMWEAAAAPLREPLRAYLAEQRKDPPGPPALAADADMAAITSMLAEAESELAGLPEPDAEFLRWVGMASACLGALDRNEDFTAAWLTSCGWTRPTRDNIPCWQSPAGLLYAQTSDRAIERQLCDTLPNSMRLEVLADLRARAHHATLQPLAVG